MDAGGEQLIDDTNEIALVPFGDGERPGVAARSTDVTSRTASVVADADAGTHEFSPDREPWLHRATMTDWMTRATRLADNLVE